MVTCNQMRARCDGKRDKQARPKSLKVQFRWQLKLRANHRPLVASHLMKGCLCCYCARLVNSGLHHESDLTFGSITTTATATTPTTAATTTTTMETDDSSRMIMNQSTASTTAMQSERKHSLAAISTWAAGGKNANLNPDSGSVNSATNSGINPNGDTKYAKGSYPGICWPAVCGRRRPTQKWFISPECLWLRVCLVLLLSACLAQAGFWTFYLPNFLKASGYRELTDMIESVERQINSTIDAHADATHFWNLMRDAELDQRSGNLDDDYYPEDSVCEQVFPLFRDKAIEYAEIDYNYYLKPLISYKEHLLSCRDLWFPEGPSSKNILPRKFEQDLYKVDLELKIAAFDLLANEPQLRRMREEMVNIWRNVKRNLDTSLACLYLRYSYRHMSADINQFALDMNLKSLHQAMEMLESAYKRVAVFKDQDRAAIERIKESVEREENLVMIDD